MEALQGWDARTRALLGDAACERLAAAKVAVFGLGGVGSHCVDALARAGVGNLLLVDGDVVDVSNINRQALAFSHTVGQRKVQACGDMVRSINPDANLELVDCMVKPEDVGPLLKDFGPADHVIDAIDDVAAKVELARLAQVRGLALVSCMGTAGKLDAQAFEFADIYDTQVCPLCRSMRSRLRKAGVERLEVLYSREVPAPRELGAPLGTLSYVPSIAGRLIAGRVIRRIVEG